MKHLTQFNNITCESETGNLGLANGEIGRCIYLFTAYRFERKSIYKRAAEDVLNKIEANIKQESSINFKDGLIGIGLGLDYLIRNDFLHGNINQVLKPIDDIVYRNIAVEKNLESLRLSDRVLMLYYLFVRLKEINNKDDKFLFEHISLKLITNIFKKIDAIILEEPILYSFEYNLPLFIIILSKIYSLSVHKQYIFGILNEITPAIMSKLPYLDSNKLFLLWGVSTTRENLNMKIMDNHISVLKREFNVERMIREEFFGGKAFFINGLTSIYYILLNCRNQFNQEEFSKTKSIILEEILDSPIWNVFEKDKPYIISNKGLLTGFAGTFFLLHYFKNI